MFRFLDLIWMWLRDIYGRILGKRLPFDNRSAILVPSPSHNISVINLQEEISRLEQAEIDLAMRYGMMGNPIDSVGVLGEAKRRALSDKNNESLLSELQQLDRLLHLRLKCN
ncbi:uncharacterized protein EV420DRAFT_1480073 [Desarmillaria tabescens]|uniref:Uncharacterized protein n=1 Tax=Armillaria tabescens TaxID=1929756 RepID=A0AA39KBY7_ARMTA|nr:uncharacterized protein EV420DRAFT_1480073 [Desarmillaria tabescens]KAK0458346.1 hypothetical protein EV420DRAFT_1480073 [Desarmillaria tabescens]